LAVVKMFVKCVSSTSFVACLFYSEPNAKPLQTIYNLHMPVLQPPAPSRSPAAAIVPLQPFLPGAPLRDLASETTPAATKSPFAPASARRRFHLALLCGLQGVFTFPLLVGSECCRRLLKVVRGLFKVEEGNVVSAVWLGCVVGWTSSGYLLGNLTANHKLSQLRLLDLFFFAF
jgi:hypothetical protein